MYDFFNIKTVHLELTDSCNLRCPQCARNQSGGKDNPLLPNTQLYLNDIKKIFPEQFIKQLKRILLCGNYGDPIVAKDTLEIIEYFREINPEIWIQIHTNGSLRNPEWWSRVGKICNTPKSHVVFSIDGLKDSNKLYRIGSVWKKIEENLRAFVNAGGYARWDYIVFKHNQHQVSEAQLLSQEIGVKEFNIKKTGRFWNNTKGIMLDSKQVFNLDGSESHIIEPPSIEEYRNYAVDNSKKIIEQYGSVQDYYDGVQIDCKTLGERSIYVSSEGLVFPCCWTHGQLYNNYWDVDNSNNEMWKLLNKCGGKDSVNALRYSVMSIIDGNFFKELQNSWNLKSCKEGKLNVCARTCGAGIDIFKATFKDTAKDKS